MENSYGIGVKNRYELFYDDDEDPVELLRQQEEEKEKRKAEKITSKDKPKGTKNVKPPPTSTTKKTPKEVPVNKPQDRGAPQRDENNRARTDRAVKFASGPRDDQRDFEERKNRRNREERTENRFQSNRERGEGDPRRVGRGGGPGRGGFRGGRGRGAPGPRGFDGRGKREFDRQSGSDKSSVKPVDKKGGEGQYNWGTVQDDLEVQLSPFAGEEATPGDTSVLDKSGDEHTADAADTSKEEGGETVEDEAAAAAAREMTLDEYKREQEQKRSRASFNIRKPGEGEENAQWKKMYVLKKKEGGEEEEEEEDDEEDDDEYARRGRQRQVVDIEINFADARRGRGGGRGRGMGRGGRPGGPQGDRARPREPPVRGGEGHTPKQSAPKVDDWNDFPSLVTA